MQQREWIGSLEWREFLHQNRAEPADKLLLKYANKGLKYRFFASQIAARQKSKNKFPEAFHQPEIIFPSSISVEQSSSQHTAQYKAGLIPRSSLGIDLTGGFGLDTYYLSQKFDAFVHIEQDPDLSAIAAHNFAVLGQHHIKTIAGDGVAYLTEKKVVYDWIYADPARRKKGQRVYGWADCSPNIFDLLPQHQNLGKNWLLKAAPMLDVHQITQDFQELTALHIVELGQEVKELLVHLGPSKKYTQLILSALEDALRWEIGYTEARQSKGTYALPQQYLYEPMACWMKSGCFQWLSEHYGVHQLHPNTHIYTSNKLIQNFPGQAFRLVKEVVLKKGNLPENLLRIISKNHPASSDELRKKLRVAYGGHQVLFAVKNQDEQLVGLLAEPMG